MKRKERSTKEQLAFYKRKLEQLGRLQLYASYIASVVLVIRFLGVVVLTLLCG